MFCKVENIIFQYSITQFRLCGLIRFDHLRLTGNDLEYFIRETDAKTFQEKINVDPKLIENALELKEIRVRECIVPRTEICAMDVNDDIEELKRIFIEEKHSRVIIYEENIDVGERIRDMIYVGDVNKIFLFLENSASIGVLSKSN